MKFAGVTKSRFVPQGVARDPRPSLRRGVPRGGAAWGC